MIRLSIFLLVFSMIELDAQSINADSISIPAEEIIYDISDIPPLLVGCEDKVCTEKELFAFIYANIRYPAAAYKSERGGFVVLQFVVSKFGQIADIKVLRDPGFDMGKAAKEALHAMNEQNIQWIPGKKNGEIVNVKYTLPVRFQLAVIKKS